MRVLSIDAWCDGQSCIECGDNNLSDTTKGNKIKCDSCLAEFDSQEGKSWSWNNWFNAGEFEGNIDNNDEVLQFFEENYFVKLDKSVSFQEHFCLDDDGYNLVLTRKSDNMPLYALEYGSEQTPP